MSRLYDVPKEDARVDLEGKAEFIGRHEPLDVHFRLQWNVSFLMRAQRGRVVMKTLKINVSVLIVFLTIGLCYSVTWEIVKD